MATGSGIFMRGKRGDVIYYVRNGKQCMRMAPLKVSNPRTPQQMKGRKELGEASKFASKVLKHLIHPYWNIVANKIQRIGYNYFVTTNMPAFRNGNLEPEKLILTPQKGLVQENFVVERQGNILNLSWEARPSVKSAREEDEMCLLILSPSQELIIKSTIAKRMDLQVEIETIEEDYHYFVFWKRDKLWSASKFIHETKFL